MENFFYNSKFFQDLGELLTELDIEDSTDFNNYVDSFQVKVHLSTLEPIFKINPSYLLEILGDCNEERLHEKFDERDEKLILESFKKSIDFKKLEEELPKYYFPNHETAIITKKDLIDYFIN